VTILDFFSSHPVFRREELAEFLARRGASSPGTADSHLQRSLRSRGRARVRPPVQAGRAGGQGRLLLGAAPGTPRGVRGVLARLQRLSPKQPQYLDRWGGGRLAAGWNLIVPAPLLAGEWEAAA
jgi:hypothetical protein